MSPAKRSPAPKKKASGASIEEWQRTTVRVVVRCEPALAERAREITKRTGVTLSNLLEWGCRAIEDEEAGR